MSILTSVCAVVLVCVAQAQHPPATTPVPILNQINRQNEDGSYSFGYEAADGSYKIETKYPSGDVAGKYGYRDDSGKLREVSYGASSQRGFEPQGDGIVVPPLPENKQPAGQLAPGQEDDGQYREDPAVYEHVTGRPAPPPRASLPAPRSPLPALRATPAPLAGFSYGGSFPARHNYQQAFQQQQQQYQPQFHTQYQQPQPQYQQPQPQYQQPQPQYQQPQPQYQQPQPQYQQPQSQYQQTQYQQPQSQYQQTQYQQPQPQYQQPQFEQPQYQQQQTQAQYQSTPAYDLFAGHPAHHFDPHSGSYSISYSG